MSHKMKVKKGDLVHMLSGKDRGKEGRVLEARPRERRVVVENLNIQKRHTRPRPIKDSSRMGGTQMTPGRQRDARLPDLQQADADRDVDEGSQGTRGARARLQARRLRPGDR